jgi:subtilisin family serine protease
MWVRVWLLHFICHFLNQNLPKMKKLAFFLCLILMGGMATPAMAQDKIPVTKADDLPRRSVTLVGKATEIVEDRDQLNRLVDTYTANLEADLEKYDIQDKATLKSYYAILAANRIFKKDYDKAIRLIDQVRALETKESEKLTTGLYLKSFVYAYQQVQDVQSEAFQQLFKEAYRKAWQALPYDVVKDEAEATRGSLSIFNPALVTSGLESQLQPFMDNNNNVVPEGVVSSFVTIRIILDERQYLVPAMLDVLNELYEANKNTDARMDIWADREVALTAKDKGTPVVVAIWDSGTDVNVFSKEQLHRDSDNKYGIGYSLVDYKKDNLLLDDASGKITTDLSELQALTKGFMDLQAGIESEEVTKVRQTMAGLKADEVQKFQEELSFYGNYAHGTHVAGIALKDNPFAKLSVARMGFDYRSLPPAHTMEHAKFQAQAYHDIVDYFKENGVRVVNMSWRYGVSAYEGLLALNGIGKDEEDRKRMAREIFEVEKKALYEAIQSAPEILFICGSGNENNDADFVEYIPASLELPNLITVGAVDSEGKKTAFTTEGKTVRFYANGFEVESFVPGGDRVKFSGTSMASPNVANLAAKILALKPGMRPEAVIAAIEKGADSLPENPELLLINPKRTIALIQGKKQENPGVGQFLHRKWTPTAQTATIMVDEYIGEVRKQNADQAKAMESQKPVLVQMFSQLVIEYKPDGTVTIAPPGSPAQTGTYTLNSEEQKILVNIAGQSEEEVIQTITANELVTTSSEGVTYKYQAVQ